MKKPGGVAIMLGLGKPKADPEEESYGDEMAYSEEQTMMAEELVDAVKSGDAKGVLDAIHGIYRSYMSEEG